ncbi:MAG TPA: hypothetical protein VIL95_03130 [Bacillota bacterium]
MAHAGLRGRLRYNGPRGPVESRPKGRRPGSDVECLVVLTLTDARSAERVHEIAYDLSLEHGLDLSVKIYGQRQFERELGRGNPFLRRVVEEGIPL